MSEWPVLWIVLGLIGIAVIIGLSVYAGMLLSKLHKQRTEQRTGEAKRLNYLHESIATISLAMQQEQCPLSEGCIRLAVLLENLPDAESYQFAEAYPAIHAMHEKIKHMPTHAARKQFPKKEIRKMDLEREAMEVEMNDAIQTDVAKLLIWIRAEKA
ncbi:MAG: DUF2489 domain-containing protein [Idiomarina sp.]|nr:DUF2489 domain-containing protein [Idiomarina sp.]